MAIKGKYTDPRTGTVSNQAFLYVGDPLLRAETKQAIIHYAVWNSDQDYLEQLDPLLEGDATMPQAQYNALRAACLNVTEPWVLTQMKVQGTRVSDTPQKLVATQLPVLPEEGPSPEAEGEFGEAFR